MSPNGSSGNVDDLLCVSPGISSLNVLAFCRLSQNIHLLIQFTATKIYRGIENTE